MLLSRLAYECVKNVIYLADSSFTYESFIDGTFSTDPDYATSINNVFAPINEAIARLNDLDRIPFRMVEINTDKIEYNRILTFKDYDIEHVYEVLNICQLNESKISGYSNLAFRMYGNDGIIFSSPYIKNKPIFIEYRVDIPRFSSMDIVPLETDENEQVVDNNIDLKKEYGISETAANYIMEYVQGKLQEPIAPELANMHVTRAEAYFNGLPINHSSIYQDCVEAEYKIR